MEGTEQTNEEEVKHPVCSAKAAKLHRESEMIRSREQNKRGTKFNRHKQRHETQLTCCRVFPWPSHTTQALFSRFISQSTQKKEKKKNYAATPSGLVVRLKSDGHQPGHTALIFTVYMIVCANQSHLCVWLSLTCFFFFSLPLLKTTCFAASAAVFNLPEIMFLCLCR